MTKLTWIGIALLLTACAGGEGEDDTMAESSGTIGESTSSTGMTTDASMSATTMTTAPTTAETLSTTTSPTTSETADSGTDESDTGTDDTGGALSCEEYCSVYMASCSDHSEYANDQDCLDNCAQWPVGTAADTGVDSVGCRIYHATVAGSTDPDMHCPHAGPSGAATCVSAEAPDCELYCTRYFGNCTGDLNAFVDEAECMADCSEWYPGTDADVAGHTIGCHSYHANAAVNDSDLHCPHAGPGGADICVL